ncbi:MAG: hypothetical protein GWN84_08765, partial [Gammaproteobacteria bacterium]|nr:hypothetical protein [Gammaproteobacteria bacterium]NIR82988.1 hypothetical protein [Gammaproteobacteria bacterium]NIU04130.1 hypothetical protein [Gammaproteobacteria bacterium]NIV51442.1 hypothetical protein [Gammaproteobacteria bacterium]NIX85404.1 hypothetical protein [Gammaproteobacteria bacterium]
MAYTTGQIREADPDTVRVDPERRELVFVISVVGRSVTCRLDGQVLQHETGSRDPDAWEAWARANIRSLNAAFGQKLSQP